MARGSKHGEDDRRADQYSTSDADLARGATPTAGDPADVDASTPFDLAEVQRDDALLDALSGGRPVATGSPEESELAALLADWRAEILAPAMPAEPTLGRVVAAVDDQLSGAGRHGRRGLRLLRPIAGAAAAVAVVMAGLTVFSYNAVPGDPLWKVKEVVFTERANSTVASIDTTTNLEEAERLIKAGDSTAAVQLLQSAGKRVTDVNESDKRDALTARMDKLMADAAKSGAPTSTVTTTPGESAAAGVTTTAPAPPVTTVPGGPATTVPPGPTELPVVPSVPPVTSEPTTPAPSPSPSPSPQPSPSPSPTPKPGPGEPPTGVPSATTTPPAPASTTVETPRDLTSPATS